MVHTLAPGDEKGPVVKRGIKAWRCAACGNIFLPQFLPKKADEEKPKQDKKLILPENKGKVIQLH